MKKLIFFFTPFFLFANDPKYFFGAALDFGSSNFEITQREQGNSLLAIKADGKSYMLSLSGGVQQFWDAEEYVGGRILGEFGMGGANIGGEIEGAFSLLGALDLLIDFYKENAMSLGIFGGFEYGMRFLVSNKTLRGYDLKSDTYGAYWRVGASVVLGNIHRFELTYKMAISPLAVPAQKDGNITLHQVYSGSQISIGYKLLLW
ncbi:outer membrane beta-barrel protein [Helicobacter cholecystus]|uniref:outer membrane beta-barrel protein n=1 Tax=Helicobacter cholecystus TaxID=45498 RepID=UPI000F6BADE3|nr:outer membrane beta-barrel protein [Helicobacter cholecystus]VEJ24539.1 Helicobacter outer membrane protein [Helicobacter cholecystus]